MRNRRILKDILVILAVSGAGIAGVVVPAAAATSGNTYRIIQRVNGFNVCLDAGFEFSVCQYSPSPDDPPALQKWVLSALPNGTDQIKNVAGGASYCLDLTNFTAPCAASDSNQQWVRVSAGNGTSYVENTSSPGHRQCLDSFWTFKACTRGDKQQIWRFQLAG